MELNNIKPSDNWGTTASNINSNFQKTSIEVEKIRYLTEKGKGLYKTAEALRIAVPSPKDGDWAIVGTTVPGPLWSAAGGVWSATGESGGVGNVELAGYATTEELNTVKKTADAAKEESATAKKAVDGAVQSAADATKAAAGAVDAASTATTAAGEAATVADTAKKSADASVTVAGEAKKTADAVSTAFGALSGTVQKTISLINVNELCEDISYTLATALVAISDKETAGDITYKKKGLVITFRADEGFETKQFAGTLEGWSDEGMWKDFGGGGSGSGAGNVFNVTELVPLESGYYTLATAIIAIPEEFRRKGLVVTFESAQGKWGSYQFIGTSLDAFEAAASWGEFGGAGTVKQITLNGEKQTPDEQGNVTLSVDEIQVDETLDPESTNPVQNAAITSKLNEIEAGTVFSMTAEEDEENKTIKLTLLNKSNAEIASVDLPATGGGGGGEGDASTTKIVLSSSVNKPVIKTGEAVLLSYTYDHLYSAGDDAGQSTGQKADITIVIKRGAVTMDTLTIPGVAAGSYMLDLTKYLMVGTTDVYVKATTTDPGTGKTQTKQSYTSVKVISLSLSSSYNLTEQIANGGYSASASVSIPFGVSGSGNKMVILYVDGVQSDSKTVTKSGLTNGNFNVSMSGLSIGRHTVQMVAEMEISDTLTVRSESIYLDIHKVGSGKPVIATMQKHADGRILGADHLSPRIDVGQFDLMSFDFAVYDPNKTPTNVSVYRDGQLSQTVSVPRMAQVYSNRFTESGEVSMKLSCEDVEYPFIVNVLKSKIDIEETTGMVLKLSAAGRSNSESNPGTWSYEDVHTVFDRFEFSEDGWTGDTLKLMNGGNITIGYQPLLDDAATTGATYEFELKCSNVTEKSGSVLECMYQGVGFRMTAQEAMMAASGGSSVSTLFAPDMNLHIGFVISSRANHSMMYLFVNGKRCGAKQYSDTEGIRQDVAQNIVVTSDAADVELRSIRVYKRALSDDEMLMNFIVDRNTADEMVILHEANDVMNDQGTDVDIDKLRAQGKSVMRIVGDVNLINETNNKKFEKPVDIYFYSKYGKEYDFILRKAGLRIQGTSSTTYARKNYRIYFDRFDKYGTTLEVNGVDVPDLMYSFKPGAKRIDIFCLKADFSDSSSTHNTGAVKLINDVWKKCGWLTPPQKVDSAVRIGIDGDPIDCFYDNDDTGVNIYLGKYNFNNEKSDSHAIYGFEGVAGFNDAAALNGQRNKCICLEFLNNSEPLCLFCTTNMEAFDAALEFRFKPDKTWDTADEEDRAAVKRLWEWIYSCKGNPTKFLNEYTQYFGNDSPFAWYLIASYFMAVDNLVKNMMLATWDGIIWYFLPYDLDTLLGGRNDSVLKYDYTITHETFDDSIGSYAFAGHDSVLWELVRGCTDKLREVAEKIRSNMSTDDVLKMFNVEQMGNWCERIYNKDGEYKYIKPLIEGVNTSTGPAYYDYLYALQGDRYAHRTYTIQNRFALLDSQYLAGTYRQDSFSVYFGYKFSQDPRKIKITSSERYYYGYGYTSGTPAQSGVLAEKEGSQVELTLRTDLIVNDPQYIYGASRMRDLDLSDVSHAILQVLNLNKCRALRTLNASCNTTQSTCNGLILEGCKNLRTLNVKGLQSPLFRNLDLSKNAKIQSLNASKTLLTGVSFAKGAPLETAVLPATMQSLELRYLNRLTLEGLTLEGADAITRLVLDKCSLIDWQGLLSICHAVKYLRVTGLELSGDGSLLHQMSGMGGVDQNGSNTSTCRLVGTYQLTRYVTDEEYNQLSERYPELNIKQPAYTCMEFDESVSDPANISNLDNKTGYKFGNDYKPSAHISKILGMRHRVLGKKTATGVVTICNLHDQNSNYFADGYSPEESTPAALDGSQGDIYVYEPRYWYKGVNDIVGRKKYAYFSTYYDVPTPSNGVKLTVTRDLTVTRGVAAMQSTDYTTLQAATAAVVGYSCVSVPLSGYKRVRFPSVASAAYGALLLDAQDRILSRIKTLGSWGCVDGMYAFTDIPKSATKLVFTIMDDAAFDFVFLTNSMDIADIEPDWVEHQECLGGTYVGYEVDGVIRSINNVIPTFNKTYDYYEAAIGLLGKGFKIMDYEMTKDISNLFLAKYGNKNAQNVSGLAKSIEHNTLIGNSSTTYLGMNDTYRDSNTNLPMFKGATVRHTNVLGYDAFIDSQLEFFGSLIFNEENIDYKWRIKRPSGAIDAIQGTSIMSGYVSSVHFQKHMDIIPTTITGSTTTYYADKYHTRNYMDLKHIFACRFSAPYIDTGGGEYDSGMFGYVLAFSKVSDSSGLYVRVSTCRLSFRGTILKQHNPSLFKLIENVS